MHRLLRNYNAHIARPLSQTRLSYLSFTVRHVYSTTASSPVITTVATSTTSTTSTTTDPTLKLTDHPLIAEYKQKISSQEAWISYQQLESQHLVQHLERDDFVQLRANLWNEKSWGTETRILQVLEDMKQSGIAWTLLEYNEYFLAKLFQARYDEIFDMYNTEFLHKKLGLSAGSFNALLATFIRLDKTEEAIDLVKNAYTKWGVVPDIQHFDRAMRRCMPRTNSVTPIAKELISTYGCAKHREVLEANLLHLFEGRRYDDIKYIMQSQQNKKLELSTYNILIKEYTDARMIRDATQVYKEMETYGVKPNGYICASMLSIYAHTRDVVSAENIVRQAVLGGHTPDVFTYNQLIKVYFKCQLSHKAFKAFEEIQNTPSLQVNAVILNTMINGLVINKEMKVANLLYQRMIQSQLKPDIVTMNTMLKGFVKEGDMGLAAKIISDMFRFKMEPDTVTFTTLIDSIFANKEPKDAQDMLNMIEKVGMTPNIYTFNAVINGWIKADKLDQAEKTVELMKKAELKPTIHTYTNLIQGYVEHMNLGKAMETFRFLLKNGIQPDRATFNFMILGFMNYDRLEDAYSCLERMTVMKLNPTKDTWKILLDEVVSRKNWKIGKKVVDMIDSSGFVIKSDSLRRPYNIVKQHCTYK